MDRRSEARRGAEAGWMALRARLLLANDGRGFAGFGGCFLACLLACFLATFAAGFAADFQVAFLAGFAAGFLAVLGALAGFSVFRAAFCGWFRHGFSGLTAWLFAFMVLHCAPTLTSQPINCGFKVACHTLTFAKESQNSGLDRVCIVCTFPA